LSSEGPVLEVRSLTGPAEEPVITDVELDVGRAATRVVLGPIHSGKSMILRHLVGLEIASTGTIRVDGETFDVTRPNDPMLRRMRTRMGVVFEGSALVSRISAVENVELPLLEHTDVRPVEARDAARELLAEVGLPVNDETTPEQLTRAGQRLVALARALALRPPLLLLDEPTQGLDPHSAAQLDATIRRLQDANGFGLLIFSNEVRHAFGRAEHIYVVGEGRIVAHGDREALMDSRNALVRSLLHRRGSP
jgi:phospholipid/cholesterol/gamma-HCH transport system ATP-binding protein